MTTQRDMSRLALALTALVAPLATAQGAPDLVPMPKHYRPIGGHTSVDSKPIHIDKTNPQCVIAAREIALRIKALGGSPGPTAAAPASGQPGIYILPCTNPVAKALVADSKIAVTADNPGPQGYAIQANAERIIVIGSDSIGTLYGAMTLRQMLETDGAGGVHVANAVVRDKPDYRYRSCMSLARGIQNWATQDPDPMPALKAGMDWLMRFKCNIVSDYRFAFKDVRKASAELRTRLSEINGYAISRGIYPGLWSDTWILNAAVDTDTDPSSWDCVQSKGELLYCWSRTELNRRKAERVVTFCRDGNFRILFLHPVDGGGIKDPELWSHRCPRCRERWADDERWKASVEQYNLWADAIKRIYPELIFTSPIYPYAAGYAGKARFGDVDEATWRQNSVDYWAKVHAGIDPMLIPQTWMTVPSLMDKYRKYFEGRPIMIYSHCFVPLGYFGTWHRYDKTDYCGNPRDIFTLNGGFDPRERWLNVFCTGEFTWNTDAPGSETYAGLYYDPETDHTGPEEIIENWVPRACRAFYGKEVGERLAPVYQVGVQPVYIMDPGYGIYLANSQRRRPLAAVDPTKATELTPGQPVAPDLVDSAERMAHQVEATRKAMDALEAALPYIDTLGPYRRKSFMYFYKRMPLWHLTARARHACYVALDLQRQGQHDRAAATLAQALQDYAEDNATAQRILAATKNEAGLYYFGPVGGRGDVRPPPERIEALLRERLASAKIVLEPRRPGPKVRVGIYRGLGAEGTRSYLAQFANVEAEMIDSLSLAVLDRYDCVFILQTRSASKNEYFLNLRRYVVEGGGGVLFQHDMCGFGRYAFGQTTPFPEICPQAVGRKDARDVVIKTRHAATRNREAEKLLQHMYYDHIIPKPGPDATVVAVDHDGAPVVVLGSVGLGKVVFDGNVNLTATDQDALLTDFNALLARGAVEWMTGVKLLETQGH